MKADSMPGTRPERGPSGLFLLLTVVPLVYLLLVGVGVIGDGFKWASGGAEGAERIFAFARNPLAGVILGVLATALVQSSSTVTSVIVGLVAGGLPVDVAVPMIMGANMGTTITNTIVSLGNIGDGKAFNKSFQAATVHDFFNLFCIVIFLPLEILFHPFEKAAGALSGMLVGGGSASMKDLNVLGAATKPAASAVVGLFQGLSVPMGPILAIVTGIVMVVASVLLLGRQLRKGMTGRAQSVLDRAVGRGPVKGVLSGTVVTVLVQSSSTTTSLVVPLAGAGVLSTRQVYPFSMGANIGTCITALLAATAVSGGNEVFALQIALVHLLYNLAGVAVFMVVPVLKDLPVRSAEWLGNRAEGNRGWALLYIVCVFFLLPGLVFGVEAVFKKPREDVAAMMANDSQLARVVHEVEATGMSIE